ncbi:MAG: peptidase T [Bacteroidaceae bacterium]|jgi:tripeptide aminopeptidase
MIERFLKYVSFDTQSAEDSATTPSTEKQLKIASYLKEELKLIGMEEVEMDELGYVYATLPANSEKKLPVVGFIAHYDTSPDCSGADVKPRIVENYDGKDILLSEGIYLSPSKFPELLDHIGEDIIVTDGHTLLGADDKAGIAEIVSACEYLIQHQEIRHGKIRVAFNPDEEIGLGAKHFNVEKFACDFAYTMDGSEVGEIEYENFNAASAKITILGCSVHPGYAKGKMLNAAKVAAEITAMIPWNETPEHTEGYQGFYHLTALSGNCEQASLSYIIRDHDREVFERRKKFMAHIVQQVNEKYGNVASVELKDQYYNMKEKVDPEIVDIAVKAIQEAGMTPVVRAIRGGTDGAQLSFMGLPCPNIFAGGINFHGPYEFCPVQSMEKAMNTIVNICKIVEQKG